MITFLEKFIKPKEKEISQKDKSVNEIIEEIHDTFYTEVDRLLVDAGIKNSLETDKESLINKSNRLKKLGFYKTQEVCESKAEEERLENLQQDNDRKKDLIDAIWYFSEKYPKYKFITEDSVIKISSKYGLIYGKVNDYIGNVPELNLQEIEEFSIDEVDKCYTVDYYIKGSRRMYIKQTYCQFNVKEKSNDFYNYFTPDKLPLEIVAPIKDFDLKNKEIKNHKIIDIPDPIVLQPVYFRGLKHYLIITAWGLEAEDTLVKN